MLNDVPTAAADDLREALRARYLADEGRVLEALLPLADLGAERRERAQAYAASLATTIRADRRSRAGVGALMQAYSLASDEGVALMGLAEALLRVPDSLTADRLLRDKLLNGCWQRRAGGRRPLLLMAANGGLRLAALLLRWGDPERPVGGVRAQLARLGQPLLRTAVRHSMGLLGDVFVLGRDMEQALRRARQQEARGYCHSFDMLGEGARSAADAERYCAAYARAIESLGAVARGRAPEHLPGISVKLSALHPRYQFARREQVLAQLVPRCTQLARRARALGIGFTVDAEEAERLDLSLDVIEAVFSDPRLDGWSGFGMAVQAYQKRALGVIDWAHDLARRLGRRLAVRLVKGAYWDTEIKLAQMAGLADYPVFTRKAATDVSFLACARRLLACREYLYPQFATHNAYSVAAILAMDDDRSGYEFQRLHGMGEALYARVLADTGVTCRIYAPVGEHVDLLPYLVRRLLENGANSSFVNNIVDPQVALETLIADPVVELRDKPRPRSARIPLPAQLYGPGRINAAGFSLSDVRALRALQSCMSAAWEQRDTGAEGTIEIYNPADTRERVGGLAYADAGTMSARLERACEAFGTWSSLPAEARARRLEAIADAFEADRDALMMLCVKEAGKNIADALAEVREAVDFCRYYASQARELFGSGDSLEPRALFDSLEPRASFDSLEPRGVVLCISPWNFPLAIFIGQLSAALAAGNTVLAKPAEQTSLIARRALELMLKSGLPEGVVELILAPGRPVGERLVPDTRIQAVMFTGSTATGRWLFQALAARADGPVPLIAETGGQNAMVVDASALPEQVVDDVIRSGFQSAGQRCSALRVLFLQEEMAERVIAMLRGAMAELQIGDPALLATDVGPVIDAAALARLRAHSHFMTAHGRLLFRCDLPASCRNGRFFAPTLYEIDNLGVLREEVFGPVVHVVRYRASDLERVIAQIRASGFGLTFGVHSRVQGSADTLAARAPVGNVYINRDMIGAVVGVQPFGGRGLSGTGPKAGGPGYLRRLVRPPSPAVAAESGDALDRALAPLWSVQIQPAHEREPSAGVRDLCCATVQRVREAVARPLSMPGPTGESNRLYHEPRGALLLLYSAGDDPAHCLLSLVAALGAGNPVRLYLPAGWMAWFLALQRTWQRVGIGLPELVIAEFSRTLSSAELIDSFAISGLVMAPDSPQRAAALGAAARQPGALLSVICEPPGPFYLRRFLVEKTITRNTAAIGGNAALLSLDERGL